MKQQEIDFLTKKITLIRDLYNDSNQQTSIAIELLEFVKTIDKPKVIEKNYPFLFCNWNLDNINMTKIPCQRCGKNIWHDQLNFCWDQGPNMDKKDRYEHFCAVCADSEEKQHPGFQKYDPSKQIRKIDIIMDLIKDRPGITENQLVEVAHIGLPLLKKLISVLVAEKYIIIEKGERNSKTHYINMEKTNEK